MYGAIIGDIAGSKYEFISYKKYPKTIMDNDCFYTDDTVMTVAIADALINDKDIAKTVKDYGRRYPDKEYGLMTKRWIAGDNSVSYFSCGNGSAMRVSAAAYRCDSMSEVIDMATKTAIITHNHPEGIKGAQAIAAAIFMARMNYIKNDIKVFIENTFDYNLNFTLNEIRPEYKFDATCQGTVPVAIVAFLESNNFEDAIKLAISLGGDADTLAAITGSIAEAYYGIPDELIIKARKFLPEEFISVIEKY